MSGQEDDQQRIQALEAEVAELRRELLEQEHRPALAAWKWFRAKSWEDAKASRQALFWSFFRLFTPWRVVVVSGGALIGYFTLLLMYQSNLISAQQSHYLQQQIYIQAQSERRRLLAEIKEKLFEPSATSMEAVAEYKACSRGTDNASCQVAVLEPAYSRQIRTEFLKTYVDIQNTPLEKPQLPKIPSLSSLVGEILDSVLGEKSFASGSGEKLVCTGEAELDLAGAFLQHVEFQHACLKNANLSWANLIGADFSYSDLSGAYLGHSDMSSSRFVGSNLRGSNMYAAILELAKFNEADLRNVKAEGVRASSANIYNANLDNIDLERADLIGTNFHGSSLVNARLVEANATGALFSDSNLQNSDLSLAQFPKADFAGANLGGARVEGAIFIQGIDMSAGSEYAEIYDELIPSSLIEGPNSFDRLKEIGPVSTTKQPITCDQLSETKDWQKAFSGLDCNE